jgi:hypothetical protein
MELWLEVTYILLAILKKKKKKIKKKLTKLVIHGDVARGWTPLFFLFFSSFFT